MARSGSAGTSTSRSRRTTPRSVEAVEEPKQYALFRYEAGDLVDPFSISKFKVIAATGPRREGGSIPDLTRPREPLESFPLDAMKLVGNLLQGSVNVALVQIDAALYQVRIGNYIGQNFGRVVGIADGEVSIKETVQDGTGDWVARDASLRMNAGETGK